MRKLSESFLQDLKSGILSELTEIVKRDRDLNLEIRQGYLNVYFKGNSLLKLVEMSPNHYQVVVHPKFSGDTRYPDLVDMITTREFLSCIPGIKENIIRLGKPSLEIEYEQMIIRANNYEARNNSEYFIVDRQYFAGRTGRFDLTGFCWPRQGRRRGQVVPVCLFEVKYALNQDIQNVHEQLYTYYHAIQGRAPTIAAEAETIFRQKLALGLFDQPLNRREAMQTLAFSRDLDQFQFILILVDYNPYSHLFDRAKLRELPFARQVKIFQGGFAMWKKHMEPVAEAK